MKNNRYAVYGGLLALILMTTSFRWPVDNGRITSSFGESRGDHFHDGIDMISPDNRVYPVQEGRLAYFWNKAFFPLDRYTGSGNYIILEHPYRIYSLYLHLNDGGGLRAHYGERDLLAYIGDTGRSYGRHLHFSVLDMSKRTSLNPFGMMPNYADAKSPQIGGFFLHIGEKYIHIADKANVRLTQHYPLLVEVFDSAVQKEKLGIYTLSVVWNGNKVLDVDFSRINFTKNGLTVHGRTFAELFDEKGYYKIDKITYMSGINTVSVAVRDYAGNTASKEISFVVRLDLKQN